MRGDAVPPPFVVGIAISDLHLSMTPPLARAGEPDWFAAMKRPLDQVKEMRERYKCPVVCAGDIFDRWNAPAELINFAIKNLPFMYAVPGQHDLPLHNYADIKRSAYWTLVEAQKVIDIKPGVPVPAGDYMLLDGYPWGFEVKPCKANHIIGGYNVAVVHAYCWTKKTSYPGAPMTHHLGAFKKKLRGYKVALFGDNHAGFLVKDDEGTHVLNCGGFMRRKSDQADYEPKVGLLWSNGDVTRVRLDTSQDVMIDRGKIVKAVNDDPAFLASFLDSVNDLCETNVNFGQAVLQYIEKTDLRADVKRAVIEAMEP